MSQNKELTFKEAFVEKIDHFLRTKKIFVWIILLILAVLIIGLFIWNTLQKNRIEESTFLTEKAHELYGEWLDEEDESKKNGLADNLLNQISQILKKYSNMYATQKALFIRAKFYINKAEWEKAATDFTDLAKSFPQSILAEESLLNAAACYEELINFNEAIVMHKQFQDSYKNSHKMSYSLFSAARIFETLENYSEAVKLYEKLESDFLTSSWTNLAQNRLIYLKANNLYKKDE